MSSSKQPLAKRKATCNSAAHGHCSGMGWPTCFTRLLVNLFFLHVKLSRRANVLILTQPFSVKAEIKIHPKPIIKTAAELIMGFTSLCTPGIIHLKFDCKHQVYIKFSQLGFSDDTATSDNAIVQTKTRRWLSRVLRDSTPSRSNVGMCAE